MQKMKIGFLLTTCLLLENLLGKGRLGTFFYNIRKKNYQQLSKYYSGESQISEVRSFSREFLDEDFLKSILNDQPLVFKKLAINTKASQNWSLENLSENYGQFVMPFWNSSLKSGNTKQTMKFKDGIEDILSQKKNFVLYGGDQDLLNQYPELTRDLELEKITDVKFWKNKFNKIFKIFITCKDNNSPPHSELGHILNIQLKGSKRWLIVPPSETNKLFPTAGQQIYLGTEEYPSTSKILDSNLSIKGWVVILEPGDVLYVPPFYWHSVESLDDSISVAYKWATPFMLLKHPLISLYMFTCRNPNIFQIFGKSFEQKA